MAATVPNLAGGAIRVDVRIELRVGDRHAHRLPSCIGQRRIGPQQEDDLAVAEVKRDGLGRRDDIQRKPQARLSSWVKGKLSTTVEGRLAGGIRGRSDKAERAAHCIVRSVLPGNGRANLCASEDDLRHRLAGTNAE